MLERDFWGHFEKGEYFKKIEKRYYNKTKKTIYANTI